MFFRGTGVNWLKRKKSLSLHGIVLTNRKNSGPVWGPSGCRTSSGVPLPAAAVLHVRHNRHTGCTSGWRAVSSLSPNCAHHCIQKYPHTALRTPRQTPRGPQTPHPASVNPQLVCKLHPGQAPGNLLPQTAFAILASWKQTKKPCISKAAGRCLQLFGTLSVLL